MATDSRKKAIIKFGKLQIQNQTLDNTKQIYSCIIEQIDLLKILMCADLMELQKLDTSLFCSKDYYIGSDDIDKLYSNSDSDQINSILNLASVTSVQRGRKGIINVLADIYYCTIKQFRLLNIMLCLNTVKGVEKIVYTPYSNSGGK